MNEKKCGQSVRDCESNDREKKVLLYVLDGIQEMNEKHKSKEFVNVKRGYYPRHDVCYPRECLHREPNESDDIYCHFIKSYRMICGRFPSVCFQINRTYINELNRNMRYWNTDTVRWFMTLFNRCTSLDASVRPRNTSELMEMTEYKNLRTRLSMNTD